MHPFLATLLILIPATGHAQGNATPVPCGSYQKDSDSFVLDDGKGHCVRIDMPPPLDFTGRTLSATTGTSTSEGRGDLVLTAPPVSPHCEAGYWLLALPHTSALVCARDLKDPLP